MLKTIEATAAVYPAPVLIVGTYGKDGKPNAMNAAWGGQCGPRHVSLSLSAHATTDAIVANRVFTVGIADRANVVPADYVGIVSANKEPDKIAKAGWTVERGERVDAPVIQELPVTMECEAVSISEEFGETRVVGEVVATHVDERFLTEDGKISYDGMDAIAFVSGGLGYHVVGERVGNAFRDGAALK